MHPFSKETYLREVYFQAHRGTTEEGKENTLYSFLHAWQFSHAIVETDVRQLADGTLICLHDETIRRVADTDSPYLDIPVKTLTWEQVQSIELGNGNHIPTLKQVLSHLAEERDRKLYLEIKDAPLKTVVTLLDQYQVTDQVLFVHAEHSYLQKVKKLLPYNQTMTWCSGTGEQIVKRFESLAATHFEGITQVQIHYPTHKENGKIIVDLPEGFLEKALLSTRQKQVTLQVCPLNYSSELILDLLEKGVRWFVSNAPLQFVTLFNKALDF